MRVSELNIGYDGRNGIVAVGGQWNRDHSAMYGCTLIGTQAIRDFLGTLRQDGYKGIQVLKVASNNSDQFSRVVTPATRKDLKEILDSHLPDDILLIM